MERPYVMNRRHVPPAIALAPPVLPIQHAVNPAVPDVHPGDMPGTLRPDPAPPQLPAHGPVVPAAPGVKMGMNPEQVTIQREVRKSCKWSEKCPPLPASAVGIGARLPARAHCPPHKRWKLSNAQLDDEVDDEMEDADVGFELSQHFKFRDLGPTTQLLGIKIDRDRPNRSISLSQPCHHSYGAKPSSLSLSITSDC
ncbi:hypothetical protein DFJ58DRAFT_846845 [Suillus subalutaceus]|uniref:uncharacterized protein n=1 Tax=Suillus subalutaceus TaxID=48586 RepID=UPI001B86487B|nr:uncharacterized protein DFJ58DRAFT_846845 [Suillus subalutaceus]KAG1836695.1 hypothetical protein DFJ58DRAFT_846845 [Suillus subalutaceus]